MVISRRLSNDSTVHLSVVDASVDGHDHEGVDVLDQIDAALHVPDHLEENVLKKQKAEKNNGAVTSLCLFRRRRLQIERYLIFNPPTTNSIQTTNKTRGQTLTSLMCCLLCARESCSKLSSQSKSSASPKMFSRPEVKAVRGCK